MVAMATVLSATPTDNYRGQWPRAYFDDRVWFHGIVTEQYQRDRRSTLGMLPSYEILWKLINMGIGDMDANEKPWDSSTRSIRYTAAMGDRLLEQIDLECERVSIPLPLLIKEAEHYFRTTAWNSASALSRRGRLRRRIRSS